MSSTHNGGSKGDRMLTWHEVTTDDKTRRCFAKHNGAHAELNNLNNGTWTGIVMLGSGAERYLNHGELRMVKEQARAILTGAPSRWHTGKKGGEHGYRFSASGALCNYFWSADCAAWLACAPGVPDERFTSAAAARAYCDKAIGGVA